MASTQFKLPLNPNYMNASGSSAAWPLVQCEQTDFFSNNSGLGFYVSLGNDRKDAILNQLRGVCVAGCSGIDPTIPSWTLGFWNCFQFNFTTQADKDLYNASYVGKTIEIIGVFDVTKNGVIVHDFPLINFKGVLPAYSGSNVQLISNLCLTDFSSWGLGGYTCANIPTNRNEIGSQLYITVRVYDESSQDCDDERSSLGTSEFLITLNGINEFDTQESRSYNLLIQPDVQHTSGSISLNNTDDLYSGFKQFIGGSCRMLDSVCCHDVGYIDIYGQVVVNGLYWTTIDLGLDDINIPHIANLNQSDVLLLRARFDDECCCYATGYTDEVEDLLNNYFGSSDLAAAAKEQLQSFVIPTRIEWHGFARLTDFCCDDSDCAEIPSHEVDINYPPDGSGGGGDNVDITCICDGLTALTSALSGKLDSLIEGQGIIAEAIEGLEVNVDSECICDNLEGIKDSIDDLELSVTNSPQINVSPCQPIVTNPVNNITVTPSTAQITNPVTVTPCQPNITITPCEPNITINPSALNIDLSGVESAISALGSSIEDGNENLVCDDEGIACILKNALNTTVQTEAGEINNQSITDVIKDKDLVCENETIVEPVDFTYTRRFKLDSGESD